MMTVILLLRFNDGKDNHFFPPLKTILSFLLVIIVRRGKNYWSNKLDSPWYNQRER